MADTTKMTTETRLEAPLYGFTSPEMSYLVADYPYGFSARCQIRYWLEFKAGKGFRFASQTANPKTGAWNKPKASTYCEFTACMFIDGAGHVQWTGLGRYSSDEEMASFVRRFPGADLEALRQLVPAKLRYLKARIDGKDVWTINGIPQPDSDDDRVRLRAEVDMWVEIGVALDGCATATSVGMGG